MIVKDYNELKYFLKNDYHKYQEYIIDREQNRDFEVFDNHNIVLKFDDEGNYTSYPNEKLEKSKLTIRKKHCNLEIPEHRHEYMEIVYLLEGEINMNINGESVVMRKNQICIMDKSVRHSNKALGNDDLAVNILLTSQVFDSVFMHLLSDDNYMSNFIINSFYSENKAKKYMLYQIEENSFLESVLINLICEYYSDSIRCESKIYGCLLLIFTELSRAFNKNVETKIDKKYSKMKNEIVEYLQREYKDINLIKAAEYFHFHPNYLSSLVKKEFGKNFKDLLIDIRMVEAAKMLRTTDKKINIIMEDIGYSNEAYFYRQFKNKYKMTPLEYRKQKTNKN